MPPSNICSGVSAGAAASAAGGETLVVAAGAAFVVVAAGAAFVTAAGGAFVTPAFGDSGAADGALDSAAATLTAITRRQSKAAQCHPIRWCWETFLGFMGEVVSGV